LRGLGARVIELPSASLLDLPRVWRLARFLRREKVELLHAHLRYANVLGALAGRLAGVPMVASLRSAGNYHGRYHAIRKGIETLALRYAANCVMANGYAVAEAHKARLGRKPIHVVQNAIEPPPHVSPGERLRLRAELGVSPQQLLLISVGRLTTPKGYFDLLDAFATVHATHPETVLTIVGGGGIRAELSARIAQLGLQEQARLLGPRDEVRTLLAAADVYVSASLWEGMPVAVMEAMAAGLPVVATAVGEVPRLLQNGNGVLVAPRQPAGLARALTALLSDAARQRALGAAARAYAAREFGVEKWVTRMHAMYAELLAQKTAQN
ncbi:MAG: glycosyltransferase, partial [Anaerolineales bacterium]